MKQNLTDSEIILLLERIKNEKIISHHSDSSLHVFEERFMVDNIEYILYYAIGSKEKDLPLVEKILNN